MKTINKFLLPLLLSLCVCACDDNDGSGLNLDGDTFITAFSADNYQATIDQSACTITLTLPEDYDVSAMTITEINVSEGAVANVAEGDVINFNFTQMIRVTNADVYLDYTVGIEYQETKILSFALNGSYVGIIDNDEKRITVYVSSTEDITSLTATITVSNGATVTPASGTTLDFTDPVDFIVTNGSSSSVYTVSVVMQDTTHPRAVYMGLADTINELNSEELTAATWMIGNVAGAQYVSFEDIANGVVDLSECEVAWWHLHIDGGIDSMSKFEDAAPESLDALSIIKARYEEGMNLLLSRFATYYAVKLGATLDDTAPNNCWGQVETEAETATSPWYFYITNHTTHVLYDGIANGEIVYMFDTGYRTTNSTTQWHIGTDWGGYATESYWESTHGASALAYGGDGAVVIWEYIPDGTEGNIVCIGSGCYDWYAEGVDDSSDQYHGNVATMTSNAINYMINY